MGKRQERIERIKDVWREYVAATAAVRLLEDELRADPNFLDLYGVRARDAGNLRANLEATFLIRLYAEFESGLRDAWRNAFGRSTHPPMKDLLAAIAGLCRINKPLLDATDEVRVYRNSLVHEETMTAAYIPIADARSRVCAYFAMLPLTW